MYYNTTSKVKLPYHATLGIQRWWDNGSVPIWITAQRQVMSPPPILTLQSMGAPRPRRGLEPCEIHSSSLPHSRVSGFLAYPGTEECEVGPQNGQVVGAGED